MPAPSERCGVDVERPFSQASDGDEDSVVDHRHVLDSMLVYCYTCLNQDGARNSATRFRVPFRHVGWSTSRRRPQAIRT